jgi:CBS domain containing-hemolysin-like protein
MNGMLILLIITCLSTAVISFVCSLSEAVLLSLNPLSLQIKSSRGEKNATQWLALKQRIERPVSAILVCNTISNTALAALAGVLFAQIYGNQWLWLFTTIITLMVIFGGELAPKMIGVHHAESLAPRLLPFLILLLKFTHPVVLIMERFCFLFKNAKHRKSDHGTNRILDIVTLVEAARAEQVIHSREEIIIIHAATLSARRIRTAMVPPEAVKVFDASKSLLDNVESLGPKLHRSYPVSADGTFEKIIGYIRIRELFQDQLIHCDADWKKLIRPALHIDERLSLTQLLALFLDQKEIAALVDRDGSQLSGWITMDDVMKVLMGERV